MVVGGNCGVGHWPGGGVAEFRVEEEGVRRLGADELDHLLGCGTQDVGHDGLEGVGGLFHWFVSFDELRRPKSEKPPVGAALGVARWPVCGQLRRGQRFTAVLRLFPLRRRSRRCGNFGDYPDLGQRDYAGLGTCLRRRDLPGSFDTQSTGRGICRYQRRTGFPANDPACAGAGQGRLGGARRCPVSGLPDWSRGQIVRSVGDVVPHAVHIHQ